MAADGSAALGAPEIAFKNDVTWEFDIPKQGKKTPIACVEALGGTIT